MGAAAPIGISEVIFFSKVLENLILPPVKILKRIATKDYENRTYS